ncbi:MAG: histidine kinase dimerization/phospho-acceptor domain-containing protein [Syntrophomonadaceae bacterium]
MKSVRLRLFTGIGLLIIFFVGLAWILNTFYLQYYYRYQKTSFLLKTAEDIDQAYKGTPADLSRELEGFERNSGLSIIILDNSYNLKYYSRTVLDMISKKDEVLAALVHNTDELQKLGSLAVVTQDPVLQTDFLNLIYMLDNQEILILSTPLLAIEESASVANRFFLYTGLLTLLIGAVAAFLLARRFTRPILDLKDIAQNMAKLDFSKKYEQDSQDEIGELGQSINSLSDQLSKSISELQEANQKLQADIERERQIDQLRKEFVSNVSHELKTPIALIQGYAEGLKLNVMEDLEDKEYYCDVIMDEANKMNRLVKELLDLSQIESGYFTLEKIPFDYSAHVDDILTKLEPMIKGKRLEVQVDKKPGIWVNADLIRSEQLLVNYLSNALNHVDDKGLIKLNVEEREGKVRTTVFNSGRLIPEEALDKVFTSFYKVDKARTRSYGGTGLGLSVVRAIQELDGNQYGVQNLPDGVEFWFELDSVAV